MQGVAEDRYREISRRLNGSTIAVAVCVHALTIVGAGFSGRSVAIVAAALAALVPFNAWVTLVVLTARGPVFAEILRAIVNSMVGIVENHYLHWPLPVWLWLPYVGVVFDAFDGPLMWTLLLGTCVAHGVSAVLDGVSWIYPVTFTVLAIFFRVVAELRLEVTRKMFEESESQRREINAAHATLKTVNERLTSEMQARAKAELELRQAQKLEAVGRLAAGVAHEINTPLQFIGDSLTFVHESLVEGAKAESLPAQAPATDTRDLVDALTIALEGVSRVSTIVSSLKEFAHPERRESAPLDVNRALLTTLTVAKHEYKYVADIVTDFEEVPLVSCNTGEINQVFLNLIVNAAHAIEDVVAGKSERGTITLRSRKRGETVEISIADTGAGIRDEVRDHIFEPFFTTKEVGRGTGQGLAMSRAIVVDRHGGELKFETRVGRGTTFFVRLPIVRAHRRIDTPRKAA